MDLYKNNPGRNLARPIKVRAIHDIAHWIFDESGKKFALYFRKYWLILERGLRINVKSPGFKPLSFQARLSSRLAMMRLRRVLLLFPPTLIFTITSGR